MGTVTERTPGRKEKDAVMVFRNLRRDWEVRRTLELSWVFLRVHRVEVSCLRGPMFWPGWPMSALSLPPVRSAAPQARWPPHSSGPRPGN